MTPTTSQTTTTANVMNPFARRPLGAPLSRIDRVGITAIFAVIAAVAGITLARADRVMPQAHPSPAPIVSTDAPLS